MMTVISVSDYIVRTASLIIKLVVHKIVSNAVPFALTIWLLVFHLIAWDQSSFLSLVPPLDLAFSENITMTCKELTKGTHPSRKILRNVAPLPSKLFIVS